jgi:5-methylcytosine-specific restriction endonuclease McrA
MSDELQPQILIKKILAFMKRNDLLGFDSEGLFDKLCTITVCPYCGVPFGESRWERMTIEHLIPVSRNGDNSIKNLSLCCAMCNQLRGSLSLPLFNRLIKILLERFSREELIQITQELHGLRS